MRVEFVETGTLLRWFDEMVNTEKYDLYYVTTKRNLIAIKNVSTSPRVHAIVKNVSQDEADKVVNETGRSYIPIVEFRWSSDIEDPSTAE